MPIAEGIAAAKLALDAGTKALDLLRYPKIDGEAVRNKITEMQDLVFSAQRALGDAEEENRSLRRELDEVKRMADIGKNFKSELGVYWLAGSSYCPACWDVDRKPVRLGGPIKDGRIKLYTCPLHKVTYTMSWAAKQSAETNSGQMIAEP
jgi:hypothetical protein